MITDQADKLRANISAAEARGQVASLQEALNAFIHGGGDGPGLAKALQDLQSSRGVIEDTLDQLETAGSGAGIAGTIGNLASAIQTSLEIVTRLAGPFGTGFKIAVTVIDTGLEAIQTAADELERQFDRVGDFADEISPVLEDLVTLFSNGLEPVIESYIVEVARLGITVDILHDAVDVVGAQVGIVGAVQGDAQTEVPLRLLQSVADIQAYATQQAVVVNGENRADNLPTAAFLDALVPPQQTLLNTLGNLGGALDVLDNVDRVFGPLERPLEIIAEVLKPIQFLLDAVGFFVDLVVEPVIKRVVAEFGIDTLFDPIVDRIADLIPEAFGAEDLSDEIRELVNSTVAQALGGIDGAQASALGLSANILNGLDLGDGSEATFAAAGQQLDRLSGAQIGGAVQQALIEALSDSALPREVVDKVLTAINTVDLSTLNDLEINGETITLSSGRILLADPNQADANGIVTLDGSDADDTLVDNGGSSLLLGNAGSDVIIVGGGNDTIDGGSSSDAGVEDEDFAVFTDSIANFRFTYEEQANGSNALVARHFTPGATRDYVGENEIANIEQIKFSNAQTSIDQLNNLQEAAPGAAFEGSAGNDFVIVGPDGPADSIETFGGNDFIVADGTRLVDAGDGDDFVVIDGTETSVEGGEGADVLSLASAPVGLKIDLSQSADVADVTYLDGAVERIYVGADEDGEPLDLDGSAPARAITGFEYVLGSAQNDTIIGGDETNAFDGDLGDDSLSGGGGADTLNGSDGDDTLRGGEGADVMIGGTGDDRFIGFEAGDDIDGGAGRDLAQVDSRTRDLSFELDFVDTPEDQAVKITNVEELELGTGQDTVTVGDQLEVLRTRGGADRVTVVEGANLTMTTASGRDSVDTAVAVTLDVDLSSGNDVLTLSGQVGAVEGAEIRADGGGATDAITFDHDATDEAGAVTLTGDADGVLRGRLEDVEGGITALEIENFEAFAFTGGDISLISGASAIRTVQTGTGDDLIDLSGGTTTGAIRIEAAGGDNTLVTKSNVDSTLIAGDGNDILRVERVDGAVGTHDLTGGAGDDVFALSRGQVIIAGGDGFDTIDFDGLAAGVIVDLIEKVGSIPGTPFVTFDGIEAVTGSRFNDSVDGDDADNLIVGGDGNDSATGGGGDDTIEGGDGADFLRGRDDDDLIFGGAGNDGLRGDNGDDELHVGTGRDRAFGGNGDDLLITTIENRGNTGVDELSGGSGIDTAVFEAVASSLGGVLVQLDKGNAAHLDGGPAFAVLDGIENLAGSEFDDFLRGDSGANAITGNGGNDTVQGGGGDDTLQGGAGFDSIDGQDGNDVILIGEGNSTVSGGSGQDKAVLQLLPSVALPEGADGAFVFENGEIVSVAGTSEVKIVQDGNTLLVQHFTTDPITGATTVLGLSRLDASVETLDIVQISAEVGAEPVIETLVVADALASGAFDTGERLAGPVVETEEVFLPRIGLDQRDGVEFESIQLKNGTVVSFFKERNEEGRIEAGIVMFDEAGNRTEVDLDLNIPLDGSFHNRIKALEGGGFVVSGSNVFQIFDETGDAITEPRGSVTFRDVIPLDSGGFIGLFTSSLGGRSSVFARSIDENGTEIGTAQRLSNPNLTERNPSGAQLADGSFVVAYEEDGSDDDVLFTIINPNGSVRRGPTDVIGSSSGSGNESPQVLALEDGSFLIFYFDRNDREIVQKHYTSSGNQISEIAVVENTRVSRIEAELGADGQIILSFDDIDGGANADGFIGFEYRVENPLLQSTTGIRAGNGFGDQFFGTGSAEDFRAFAGDDTIFAEGGNDTIRAGEGDDTVNAGGGNDAVLGGSGNDSVNGNVGNDTIDGGHGDDVLSGGSGNDIVRGGTGDDTVRGFNDNDTLFGDDGDDVILGENGNDSIEGGDGNDLIVGGNGKDTVRAGDGDDTIRGQTGDDAILGDAGIDTVIFSGRLQDYTITGSGGLITVVDTAPTQNGNDGTDKFRTVELFRFEADGGEDVTVGFSTAGQLLVGASTVGIVFGSDGDDIVRARGGDDTVTGAAGDDRLFGDAGDDVLDGGEGDDFVFGGTGADLIRGGAGADTLIGSDGPDILEGGAGADTFVLLAAGSSPEVEITDFTVGEDRLAVDDQLLGLGSGGVDPRDLTVSEFLTLRDSGTVGYDARSGELSIDTDGDGVREVVADLGTDIRLGLDDVLIF